jgi:hypothetical protein
VQPTTFLPTSGPDSDKRVEFQTLYQELIDNESRTRRICDDVAAALRDGRSPLVLTERNDHLDLLEQGLATRVQHVVVLRAGLSKKQRQVVTDRLAAIPGEEARVILATGKYVGEGFDDSRLDTLFLTLPVSWRGTIAQYAGRLHRLYDGKREVLIYDYVDLNVPMLARMAETTGRFRLNVSLPIPFDGSGQLEVDLLCADSRVAVELDGAQHLADPMAYRRDRRKDQLLQESGYLVLRFLAEDVGRELDAVLNAILRAVSHREAVPTMSPLQFVRRGRT